MRGGQQAQQGGVAVAMLTLKGGDFFFMDFAEDNLSSLFKPTDRLDMTARACVRVVCRALSLCACVFQAARLGPGAQAGVQHGGPR